MSEDGAVTKAPGEGGRLLSWAFRHLAGPAEGVKGAVQGGSAEARDAWKRDLAERKRFTREQRERKRADREAQRRS
ncbi:hypothetical protein ACGFIP_18270 [Micromonospora zamorensis]|jgi:hypothetical protein|uniref:CsbD-like n=1 Tax=Micromonospora zamorensis TaxID=709883 RepID=A0ABZ1PDK2_9ACTN|nr:MULTISPECIES: hypothetical protein [Micromonospora]MBQ0981762.1 hypothetical protein [Micromonospora sp. M61]MBQ1036052.1 hypothetical protein [Micromonospora sp. C81]WSK45801.1 hypothetical protein OG423_17155 [Micromonospora zamorensis]WTE85526.1 hypothetical protein OHA01_23505 [Micromonospora zamorensis]WTI20319.1 hypothetical protein OG886_25785 [Micromonospora zamorensis]